MNQLPRHQRPRLFRTPLSSSIHRQLSKAEHHPDAPRYYVHAKGPHQHEDVRKEALNIIYPEFTKTWGWIEELGNFKAQDFDKIQICQPS